MTVNAKLLTKTLDFVEANPGLWDQGTFRCGTTGCFAWHAALLAGAKPFPDSSFAYVIAEDDDDPREIVNSRAWHRKHRYDVVHVAQRAERVLGLSTSQAIRLFYVSNTLDDLRDAVIRLIADPNWIPRSDE